MANPAFSLFKRIESVLPSIDEWYEVYQSASEFINALYTKEEFYQHANELKSYQLQGDKVLNCKDRQLLTKLLLYLHGENMLWFILIINPQQMEKNQIGIDYLHTPFKETDAKNKEFFAICLLKYCRWLYCRYHNKHSQFTIAGSDIYDIAKECPTIKVQNVILRSNMLMSLIKRAGLEEQLEQIKFIKKYVPPTESKLEQSSPNGSNFYSMQDVGAAISFSCPQIVVKK